MNKPWMKSPAKPPFKMHSNLHSSGMKMKQKKSLYYICNRFICKVKDIHCPLTQTVLKRAENSHNKIIKLGDSSSDTDKFLLFCYLLMVQKWVLYLFSLF